MNPNNQPPKMTAKELANIVKQFVRDQVAEHQNRPQQAQQKPINTAGRFIKGLLQPQNQNHYPPETGMIPYQQQPAKERYQGMDHEIRECLRAHNEARHQAPGPSRPDLKWNDSLARHAQRWADHMARHDMFDHDPKNKEEGENLYMNQVWGRVPERTSFRKAVEDWNRERVYYRGEKIGTGDFSKYGHYTQNIWPTTTHVGMARAVGRNGKQYIAARYSPAGNVYGRSAYE